MKGIIFNLLEQVITKETGEETWDLLLESTHLSGVYTSLGNYADSELRKLVMAASTILRQPADAVLRLFGAKSIPLLAAKYPLFFDNHHSTRPFLLTLNDIIHPEVRKLYPGADVPEFAFDTSSENALVMVYTSPRKLCALAEGLISGAAAHYGEEATITQDECMNRADQRCVIKIVFHARGTNG